MEMFKAVNVNLKTNRQKFSILLFIDHRNVACKAGVFWSRIHELFSGMTFSRPLVFFIAFQDGGHDQCTSEFSLKNACSAG